MRNMKKTAFFLLLAVCGLWACNDNWNDYYDGSSVNGSVDTATTVLDCSIIEFFQSHDEYAEFYKLLQDVGAHVFARSRSGTYGLGGWQFRCNGCCRRIYRRVARNRYDPCQIPCQLSFVQSGPAQKRSPFENVERYLYPDYHRRGRRHICQCLEGTQNLSPQQRRDTCYRRNDGCPYQSLRVYQTVAR